MDYRTGIDWTILWSEEAMSEAIEGEVIPASQRLTSLDKDAVELGDVNRGGRPTDMTPDVVTKLIAAFNNGFSITEACQYADIARVTYYRWLEKDDEFSYKMSVAQTAPNRKAKANLIDIINNPEADPIGARLASMYWLDRRDPDFKSKTENTVNVEVAEKRNNLKEVLNAISQHAPSVQPTTTDVGSDGGVVAPSPTDIS